MLKPGLAEIFTAVNGVIGEGANLVRKGVAIDHHPLSRKGYEGATLLWNAQYRVIRHADQDKVARPLIRFLQASLPVLDQYAALGKTADVRDHARDILAREEQGSTRPAERFKEGGIPAKPFKTSYTGKETTAAPAPALAMA